jgi:ligand-binding sensor protein
MPTSSITKDFVAKDPDAYLKLLKEIEDVQKAKTVKEVDFVQHGRWLINPDGYYPYCSVCKEEPDSGKMTKHCPNCGAKMDLK